MIRAIRVIRKGGGAGLGFALAYDKGDKGDKGGGAGYDKGNKGAKLGIRGSGLLRVIRRIRVSFRAHSRLIAAVSLVSVQFIPAFFLIRVIFGLAI